MSRPAVTTWPGPRRWDPARATGRPAARRRYDEVPQEKRADDQRRRASRRRGRAGPGPRCSRTSGPVHGNPQPAQIDQRRQAVRSLSTAPIAGARSIRPRSPGIRRGAPAASRDQGTDAGTVPESGRCGALPRRGSHRRDARSSQHRPGLRRGPHRGWLGLRRLQVHRRPHARRPDRGAAGCRRSEPARGHRCPGTRSCSSEAADSPGREARQHPDRRGIGYPLRGRLRTGDQRGSFSRGTARSPARRPT